MKVAPEFEVGSTRPYGTGPGELYEPLPAEITTNYAVEATSPKNLFPFTSSEHGNWSVYAGDCPRNNPETVAPPLKNPENVIVTPGGTTAVKIPTSYVTLNVYKGTATVPVGLATSEPYPVTITNTECSGYEPDNETAVNNRHNQETTTGTTNGGHLTDPFQPFGKFTLCLYNKLAKKTYTLEYTNASESGSTPSIYLEATGGGVKTNQSSNTC
jgi:hypothetical protein